MRLDLGIWQLDHDEAERFTIIQIDGTLFKGTFSNLSEWRYSFNWCIITQDILISNFSYVGQIIWIQEKITLFYNCQ